MVLDNGPGLAVRTDMNAAIQALASMNSGPIEPVVKYPGQLWLDTSPTPPAMRQRDLANTAWVAPYLGSTLGFTDADIGFGARTSGNRFVWNDKADLSGTDVATLSETGQLALPVVSQRVDTSALTLHGGTVGSGAHITLAGGTHATLASQAFYDASAHTWRNAAGNTTAMTLSSAGALNVTAGVTSGGTYTAGTGTFIGAADAAMLCTSSAAGTGYVYLRPNGPSDPANSMTIYDTGLVTFGPSCAMGLGGSGRYFQFVTNYYLNWNSTGGDLDVILNGGIRATFGVSGSFTITSSTAIKSSGTAWANPSDERIKEVVGDYDVGLAEVLQLQPKVFTYKGNDTLQEPGHDPMRPEGEPVPAQTVPYPDSPHYQMAVDDTEVVGFIAQEVETVMPGMVTQGPGWIDGVEVQDFRTLDTSNLILALVNAVKELSARVEALEAA
jgi:hypothetical protein